jgi:membrane protein
MDHMPDFFARIWTYRHRLKRWRPLLSKSLRLCGKASRDLWMDGGFTQAAAISYYLVVSIFPMLLLVIGIAGFFLNKEDLQNETVLGWLTQYFPKGTRIVFKENLKGIFAARNTITMFGSIVLVWSSTLMFDAINQAVNAAWGMRGNARFLLDKLKSLVLICVIVIAALFSTFLTTRMALVAQFETNLERFPFLEGPLNMGREVITFTGGLIPFIVSVMAFGLAYRLLPRVAITIRDVWPAAVAAALLWEWTKVGFVSYMTSHTKYQEIYGSISAVMVLMLWAYVSSLILAWGAELTSEIWKDRRRIYGSGKEDVSPENFF